MKHKDALASILNVNSRILKNKIDSNISYLHATFKVENHVLFLFSGEIVHMAIDEHDSVIIQ